MRFSVECPVDGQVAVGISDISSVIVREGDMVDVVFECPRCGARIRVSAQVPRALLSSLEEAMLQDDVTGERRLHLVAASVGDHARHEAPPIGDSVDQARIDSYCEYFRRQLESVSTVEAILSEIDLP